MMNDMFGIDYYAPSGLGYVTLSGLKLVSDMTQTGRRPIFVNVTLSGLKLVGDMTQTGRRPIFVYVTLSGRKLVSNMTQTGRRPVFVNVTLSGRKVEYPINTEKYSRNLASFFKMG